MYKLFTFNCHTWSIWDIQTPSCIFHRHLTYHRVGWLRLKWRINTAEPPAKQKMIAPNDEDTLMKRHQFSHAQGEKQKASEG